MKTMKVTAVRFFSIVEPGQHHGRGVNPGETIETDEKTAKGLFAEGYVTVEADLELDEARKAAEALGVKVDGRWKLSRVQDEIAKAQAAADAAAADGGQ